MEPTRWLLRVLVVIALFSVLAVSAARTTWDLNYRQTVVAVNLGDLGLQQTDPESLTETIAELNGAGATAVTVSPRSVNALHDRFFPQRVPDASISTEALSEIREQGLALYWRLQDWVPPETYRDYLDELLSYAPAGVIVASAVGVPSHKMEALEQTIRKSESAMLGWAEFIQLPTWPNGFRTRHLRVFRAHLLERSERNRLTDADAMNRYLQAVRERRVRMVEVRGTSPDQGLRDVAGLREQLEQSGYPVAPSPEPVPDFSHPASHVGTWIRDGVAWLLAVLGPLAGYGLMRRRLGITTTLGMSTQAWLLASGVSVLGGLATAAVLSDPSHFLGLRDIPGVRPAMVAPIVGVALWTLARTSWRTWNVLDVAVWLGVGAALIVALLRSGNYPSLPVLELERELRDALEGLLVVRPRFKEFLIGHPALLVWASLGATRWRPWAVGLLAIGMLGQVSIVNSFLHLHTPLWVTGLRTFHGLWLGLLIGLPIVVLVRVFARRWARR